MSTSANVLNFAEIHCKLQVNPFACHWTFPFKTAHRFPSLFSLTLFFSSVFLPHAESVGIFYPISTLNELHLSNIAFSPSYIMSPKWNNDKDRQKKWKEDVLKQKAEELQINTFMIFWSREKQWDPYMHPVSCPEEMFHTQHAARLWCGELGTQHSLIPLGGRYLSM